MTTTPEPIAKKDSSNCDDLLERSPELEAWHGIALEHLSATYDRRERTLTVFCEIRPETGPKLKHDMKLHVALYDQEERITAQNYMCFNKEKFFGFEVARIAFFDLPPKKRATLGKIKIFPAKW